MKRILFAAWLLLFTLNCRGQTITFWDMAQLVTLSSAAQVDNILLATGKFKLNNKEEVQNQILTHYQSIDKNKQIIKGETVVTGAYRTTADGDKLHYITYLTIYPDYIYNLMKQMTRYGYRLTFTGKDSMRKIYIYDNPLNHITILLQSDHTINSVQIRQKDVGVEQ